MQLLSDYTNFFDAYVHLQQGRAREMCRLLLGGKNELTVRLDEVYSEVYEALFAQAEKGDRLFVIHAGDFLDWRKGLFNDYLESQGKAAARGLAIHRLVLLTMDDMTHMKSDEISSRLFAMSCMGIAITVSHTKKLGGADENHKRYNLGIYSKSAERTGEVLCLQYKYKKPGRGGGSPDEVHIFLNQGALAAENPDCPISLYEGAFGGVGYDLDELWVSPLDASPAGALSGDDVCYVRPKQDVATKKRLIADGLPHIEKALEK